MFQAMLESSRETCSGIQLEVNEKILDSCNQLMKVMHCDFNNNNNNNNNNNDNNNNNNNNTIIYKAP